MSLPVGLVKTDPRTGELHMVSRQPTGGEIVHVVMDPTGRQVRCWRIEVGERARVYDFGLTERYLVLYDAGRVGVMPRTGGIVRWFTVSQVLDVWDEGTAIVTDLVGFTEDGPRLDRWTIDPSDGRVSVQRLDEWRSHSVGTETTSSGVVKPKTLLSQ